MLRSKLTVGMSNYMAEWPEQSGRADLWVIKNGLQSEGHHRNSDLSAKNSTQKTPADTSPKSADISRVFQKWSSFYLYFGIHRT